MSGRSQPRPSVGLGAASARRLWAVAVLVWLVPQAVLLPSVLIVAQAVLPVLGQLPDEAMVSGDRMLVVVDAMRPVVVPAALVMLVGLAALGLWGAWWRAGVVGWRLWTGGGPPRLAQLLGLGLVLWWRFLRLHLVSAAASAVLLVGFWLPLGRAALAASDQGALTRTVALAGCGLGLGMLLWAVSWAAVLRGSWVVGRPDRHSAVRAWLEGVAGAFRQPLATFGVLALWAVPIVGLPVLPLLLGAWLPWLRGGVAGTILLQLAALAAAWCRVALLASFAPVSGMIKAPTDDA